MKLINYITNLKVTSIAYLLVSATIAGLTIYNPLIGLGILLGIAFMFVICLAYMHIDKINTAKAIELELQEQANTKALIEKALPPNLIAFPKGTTRVVSCVTGEDIEKGRVILNLRLVLHISEIDKIEEYKNYLKDGLEDVLTSSPIYFHLTDDQRAKYNIYNFQN